MMIRRAIIILMFFIAAKSGYALEPDQILVIANQDVKSSVQIAEYYCDRRDVPRENILALSLGTILNDKISRADYEKKLAEPIRKKLSSPEFADKIKCLLTTYGVPIKVGNRGPLEGSEDKLRQLKKLLEQKKNQLEQLEQNSPTNSTEEKKKLNSQLVQLQSDIDPIIGSQTDASVDSELSMVLFDDYQLYRWQPNELKGRVRGNSFGTLTLMVCRLDGPDCSLAMGLVDKAIKAEKSGLNGIVYVDSRGITNDKKPLSFGYFDQSLRDLAVLAKFRTQMPVIHEQTEKLFEPEACPQTAIYCGWYSLKKYVDAFDFVDGAVGYHISSWEAVDLRDPNSTQWCPAMLVDGITATLGAVAEPYLYSFPEPKKFFLELFNGSCLVEAYYRTKPFNSWRLILIGDPLYTPFPRR